MIRSLFAIVALGAVTTACGNSSQSDATQTAQNNASGEPELMASAAAPGGVVPGGAVDVLQREGWRVTPVEQQANAAPVSGADG